MTAEPRIVFKYEGRDADLHTVEMRTLGRSMIGLDKIISDGIILIIERRLPIGRERAFLAVKAQEPSRGSQEIITIIKEHAGQLALGYKAFTDSGGKEIWHWISLVLEHWGGRKKESEKHLEALVQLTRDHLASRDQSEERFVGELSKWRSDIMTLVGRQSKAAIGAAAPIGPSVRSLAVSVEATERTTIDEPMADAIRAKGELELGDLQEMTLATDGWVPQSSSKRAAP